MTDFKMQLINKIRTELATQFNASQILFVEEIFIKNMADYEIHEKSHEVEVYHSANEKLLKQFSACLYVDGKSPKTAEQYRRTCRKLAELTGKDFTETGVYDIRYFLAYEKERGISERSLENERSNISAFFQWMAKEDIINKNPCINISPIKYPEVVRIPFSDIEIDQLRGGCINKKERAIIELLLSTGLRVSELSNLKITDIDPVELSVNVRYGKGGKGRITYTTALAMKHMYAYWNERKEQGEYVFYNGKHQMLKPGGVRHILNVLAERSGVSNVHPHRFRRTFASGLAARGMDIQEIKILLGHSNINTTMEYVYTSESQISTSYKKYIA